MSSVSSSKFKLQKQGAALKTMLSFSEEEAKLKLLMVQQEHNLEQLKLKKQLAETEAKLGVCLKNEEEEFGFSDDELKNMPMLSKEEHLKRYFENSSVTVGQTSEMVQFQATPVNLPTTELQVNINQPLPTPVSSSQGNKVILNPNVEPFQPVYTLKEGIMSTNVTAPVYPIPISDDGFRSLSPVSSTRPILDKDFHPTDTIQDNLTCSLMKKLIESNTKLAEMSMQQIEANRQLAISGQLPKISIPVFNGDPLQYPMWNSAFTAMVDNKSMDANTKLNFLNQYVTGRPKRIIEHYLLLGTQDSYIKAKDLLHKRYGNDNVISSAFINKLDNWPRIGIKDSDALREFSDFLDKILAARKSIHSLAVLDFAKENVKLLSKLPYYLESKWRDHIKKWRKLYGEESYPPFNEFADYVREMADKANIPELSELSCYQMKRSEHNAGNNSKLNKSKTTTSFTTTSKTVNEQDHNSTDNSCTCLYCEGRHHLSECKDFLMKPYSDRKKFFFKMRLCMGCASSVQHKYKECSDKQTCKVCNGAHNTCLHREINLNSQLVTSHCLNVCPFLNNDGITENSMIVPVWIRHKDEPSREILRYAVLDDQSNVGFVSRNVCEALNIEGPSTQLLLSTMQERNVLVQSSRITGLEILDYKRENIVKLPVCFQRDAVPAKRSQIPRPQIAQAWSHLEQIADQLLPYRSDIEISLLIGNNCPRAIRPREIIAGKEDEPYGQKSLLGWGIVGNVCTFQDKEDYDKIVCHKVIVSEPQTKFTFSSNVKEVFDPEKVIRALEQDFVDITPKGKPLSIDDKKFLRILEDGIKKTPEGHYEMPLPLKSDNLSLPYNRALVVKRWKQLKARLEKNPKLFGQYQEFMNEILANCAEKVPEERLSIQDGKINYVPHTGVFHPKKPDQLRVVFDCSARYEGVSLNDCLFQGPDLLNGMIGVLCRFREDNVAFMTDIKGMFHQFDVAPQHRDLLRFLWWEDSDPSNKVIEYRMKVHLFGASSSPGCANFGLKRAADDGEEEFGTAAANFIRNDFYVDDGLKSLATPEEVITLIKASQKICSKAGLKLHKVMSNKKEVLEAFPVEERAKGVKDLDLAVDPLPLERALGVMWCVENDSFQFRIELRDRPFTRRGILSSVSSIYDPKGFVAPVTLKGKQILQKMCQAKVDWDSPIPDQLHSQWEKWRQDVLSLEKITIPRCYKPENFGAIKAVELHHFSDACEEGYGQCTYLRQVNEEDKAYVAFVIGKARVTPLKKITIPRLELSAAVISARMSKLLLAELSYSNIQEFFWTDSKIVLGYVNNEARRFHVYVASRVQEIRDQTDPGSWFYVSSDANPADDASRGVTAKQLIEESHWLTGPTFLLESGEFRPHNNESFQLSYFDAEVKKAMTLKTYTESSTKGFTSNFELERLERFSSWIRMLRAVAICLKFKQKLRERKLRKPNLQEIHKNSQVPKVSITVEDLHLAVTAILLCIQQHHFHDEVQVLAEIKKSGEIVDRKAAKKRNQSIKKSSSLFRLDPYLDKEGVIRVGGRLGRSSLSSAEKHPVIMPRKCHVTELLVRHHHENVQHMGRGMTHNDIRQSGYWITGGSSVVSNYISRCLVCRKKRRPMGVQKMSDLPEERLEPSPPFSYCGVDYFGPFLIREKRSDVKRYGVLFTCLVSRSIHLETAISLDTSSFINALRRFLSRRGPVRQIRSDQGSNFVGARNELKLALSEMDQDQVQRYLVGQGCDWIPFKMNVPHASHMGGVWERMIRTVRNTLETLLNKCGNQLNDEMFRTFMTEVEGIVNSRPLTVASLSDSEAPTPLTPMQLLTMKSKILLPPPGQFQKEDLYSRKWWKRVQYLANEFWMRWRKEYIQNLQSRQKWTRPQKNLQVGDIVISKENEERRNLWPLARVIETHVGSDGFVRTVKILMADSTLDNNGRRKHPPTVLERPIHKLVLILPTKMNTD